VIHVSFLHKELDLVFPYIKEQKATFAREGIPQPSHRILVSEEEIIVELKSNNDEEV
jgi:hypothetical protein